MRTICYHLFSALTVFAAGMGQTQVVRAGRLVGVKLHWSGIAGAGGTFGGNCSALLNQNSVNESATNNPAREPFLASGHMWALASTGFQMIQAFVPLNVPIQPGDLLTINAGNAGTAAPASSNLSCDFYVVET